MGKISKEWCEGMAKKENECEVGVGHESSDFTGLLSAMTTDEKKAAARFNETCEDGESYDVPLVMMLRLETLGLVKHGGGGYCEQTDLMMDMKDKLEQGG